MQILLHQNLIKIGQGEPEIIAILCRVLCLKRTFRYPYYENSVLALQSSLFSPDKIWDTTNGNQNTLTGHTEAQKGYTDGQKGHTETLSSYSILGQNNQKPRQKYWATHLFIHSFTGTAYSFACSGLLALLAPSAALACSLRSFPCLWPQMIIQRAQIAQAQ